VKRSTSHLNRILGSDTLGSRDRAVVRTLESHQCGLVSIPARCHMWVEFVVGSRLARRISLLLLTLLPQKQTFPNSNRPFPSHLVPPFQNESSCKTSHREMSLICMKTNM